MLQHVMPISSQPAAGRGRRLGGRIGAASLVIAAAVALAIPEAPTPAAAAPVTIKQFPVQGPCVYMENSFGAPRSNGGHQGVDIMPKSNKAGDYVYAVADGRLTRQFFAGTDDRAGNGWKLELADGTFFYYFHLSTFAGGLTTGSKVVSGQIIGQVGATGNAGGPHLHFEVHPQGGPAVNPYPIIKPVDGCNTTVVPPQPDGGVDPGLQRAVRLSQVK